MNFQLQSTTDHKMNAKIDEQSSLQLPSTAPLPVHVRPVRRLRSPSPNRPRTRQGTQDVIRQLRQSDAIHWQAAESTQKIATFAAPISSRTIHHASTVLNGKPAMINKSINSEKDLAGLSTARETSEKSNKSQSVSQLSTVTSFIHTALSPSLSLHCAYDYAAYSVVLRTECDVKMGAHANVFVQLTDSNGKQTDKCLLKRSITHTYKFCRGHELHSHNCWRISSIDVIEHTYYRLFQFRCDEWFETEVDDLITHKRLEVAAPAIQILRSEDFLANN
ncbi:PLAT domain-containing protein [Aphelenchoides besseyi]|nr:PLAT domain-containing protein [Aphelenchoides besseyi]